MAIKIEELQQAAAPRGTDSLLLESISAGTAQLSLAQAAAFFGGELIKTGNPVGAALSNKAAKSAQDTVEKTGASARTVELAASELPAFFDALPRLLTEDLIVNVSGTLNEQLYLHRFYGSGSIWIEGSGGCAFRKGFAINHCSASITLRNLEFCGEPVASDAIVSIQTARYVALQHCTVTGSKSADSGGEVGVKAELCSLVNLSNCGITNCRIAAMASRSSILTLRNDSGDGFTNNSTGLYAYNGGILLLAGSTPELLGGAANVKSGGLIVKSNGTLL